ncbi:Fe-S cluster assembly protein SufD [Rhizobiales bacterium TNE-4]|nr:Fe-S cluster assembly protein SufD [Rhizobiales bacterium TNE-4]MBV1826523.1 Fe-S cluster assembly protein SufD [Rhizobiales bacterium TNE-4]
MSDVTPIRTPAESALIAAFPAARKSLPGNAHVIALREAAFNRFEAKGLPHRRVEEWKYTDLRTAMRDALPLAQAPQAATLAALGHVADPFAQLDAYRITIVDGHHVPSLSVDAIKGVTLRDLAASLSTGDGIASLGTMAKADDSALALNAAFMQGGVVIEIAKGVALDKPIYLRFLVSGDKPHAIYPRVLVTVGEGASATLIEAHQGADGIAYQVNGVVEIKAGAKTHIQHVRLNAHGDAAIDLSSLGTDLGEAAEFKSLNFVMRPALTRHQVFARFSGEHIKLDVSGAALLKGKQHADSTLYVDHAMPHGESRELFKHVIDDEAVGVFQGKIVVQQIAQKTDGRMMSQAILLSDDATMNNKPELEIFADDVACGHGATCGALDEDLLFYLRARGLPKPEAEALMLAAFVGEALEKIENDAVREALEAQTQHWLLSRAIK